MKTRNANMKTLKIIQQSKTGSNKLDKLSDDHNIVMVNP